MPGGLAGVGSPSASPMGGPCDLKRPESQRPRSSTRLGGPGSSFASFRSILNKNEENDIQQTYRCSICNCAMYMTGGFGSMNVDHSHRSHAVITGAFQRDMESLCSDQQVCTSQACHLPISACVDRRFADLPILRDGQIFHF